MALTEHTAAAADSVAEHSETIGTWIQHHLQNTSAWHIFPGVELHLPHIHPFHFLGLTIDLSIKNHVVMLWIAGIFTLMLFRLAYKKGQTIPKGFGVMMELLIVFVRDEVAIANMGEKEGRRFAPFLITVFFFILISNLMGLVPMFSTSTGNINVTLALALVTFGATQYFGVKEQGLFGYYKNLVPHGVPILLWPLMFVIEIMGLIAKHVALTIRLFANMVAGHIVLFAFLGLIIMFKTIYISPVSVGFGIFVYFLELLVAFIQAYIFTVLSALFIGMSVNPEH